jgi:hypothetical protein
MNCKNCGKRKPAFEMFCVYCQELILNCKWEELTTRKEPEKEAVKID